MKVTDIVKEQVAAISTSTKIKRGSENKHRCSYCKYFYLSAIRDSYGDCLKKDGQVRGAVNRNEPNRKCFVRETDKEDIKRMNAPWVRRLWPPENYDEFWGV